MNHKDTYNDSSVIRVFTEENQSSERGQDRANLGQYTIGSRYEAVIEHFMLEND